MNFNIVYFKDIDKALWNRWVNEIDETSYHHSWSWLNYCSKFSDIKEHLSFVVLDSYNSPIGICPLAITHNKAMDIYEITFSGIPAGVPAMTHLKYSLRRKVLDFIFNVIKENSQRYGVKKINMVYHSLNSACCSGKPLSHKYSFELLRYGMLYHVDNTSIIDLTLPEEELSNNMSTYHRRHIKRSKKDGIEVKVFNKQFNSEQLKEHFYQYQNVHFNAAGKVTRPQETWDTMYEGAVKGEASLFVAFINDTPISYLYCGEFSSMAFGWSQANVKGYEKQYPLRHLLEWEAIIYYKRQGYKFYEIGEIYYGPQVFHIPTEKEINISIFKQRYGGFLMHKILWIGFFDDDVMKNDVGKHMEKFINYRDFGG